jgi:hypothetical protein
LRPNQHFFCLCSLPLLLQAETLPRPSDEEFVEAGWGATNTTDDIPTTTTIDDIATTTTTTDDDVATTTTTTTEDIIATTTTTAAATLPAPAATTMLPVTTTDSLSAPCSSCLVDEAAAAASPANTSITSVAVDSKPAAAAAVLAAPPVFLYVEADSSRCSSSDGAADSPGYPCMLQHDEADAVAAEDHGGHTLAAAAAAAAKGTLPLLLQQLPAECDTAAALAGLADSASSLQQHVVRLHSLPAAAAVKVVGGGGTQGSKASAGWLRRVCSRLFACGSSSSLCMVDGV